MIKLVEIGVLVTIPDRVGTVPAESNCAVPKPVSVAVPFARIERPEPAAVASQWR